MVPPKLQSGADYTWAPAGLVYYRGNLFFAGLRGEALYQVKLDNLELKTHFYQRFGRLRAVVLGPDGFIYISTSNLDGRGLVREGDDKIIKINPKILL